MALAGAGGVPACWRRPLLAGCRGDAEAARRVRTTVRTAWATRAKVMWRYQPVQLRTV
jgi:hypothetical protein